MFEASRQIKSAAAGAIDTAAARPFPAAPIDFRQIRSLLGRGKKTILWTTAASLLLMALLVLAVPHRYTATTQISH